ncbi:DUF551 domain-containing protein [Klebsiella pneumoniae]
MKFEEWLSQQNGVIEVDCGCVTTEAFYHWMCVAYEAGNSLVIPDGWTGNDKANAALMMLDRIETADPVDDDRIDGIKRIVRELVAATQPQNAPQNIPEIIPGWIPVSERMPERGDYLVTDGCDFDVQLFNGEQFIPGFVWEDKITHWMPLPAAPKEVK